MHDQFLSRMLNRQYPQMKYDIILRRKYIFTFPSLVYTFRSSLIVYFYLVLLSSSLVSQVQHSRVLAGALFSRRRERDAQRSEASPPSRRLICFCRACGCPSQSALAQDRPGIIFVYVLYLRAVSISKLYPKSSLGFSLLHH